MEGNNWFEIKGSILRYFFEYLRVEKGFSPHTSRAYKKDLEQFFDFVENIYFESESIISCSPLDKIDTFLIHHYIGMLYKEKKAKRTISRKISSLRTLWRFLINRDETDKNPMEEIPFPKKEHKLIIPPDKGQMADILDSIPPEGFFNLRDRALLEMFYAVGARVSEVAGLDLRNIDLDSRWLKVMGKGHVERFIPFHQKLVCALEDYLPFRDELIDPRESLYGPVFINCRGGRLTDRSFRVIVNKWVNHTAMLKKVSPHTFRHAFGTHLLEMGADIREVQELLGHKTISSTQVYLGLDLERLLEVYDKAHPLASGQGS